MFTYTKYIILNAWLDFTKHLYLLASKMLKVVQKLFSNQLFFVLYCRCVPLLGGIHIDI